MNEARRVPEGNFACLFQGETLFNKPLKSRQQKKTGNTSNIRSEQRAKKEYSAKKIDNEQQHGPTRENLQQELQNSRPQGITGKQAGKQACDTTQS